MALPLPIRFDAHCHLFNIKYMFQEVGAMLFDASLGRYPRRQGPPDEPSSVQEVSIHGDILDLLAWLKNLGKALTGSEVEHLEAVLAAGARQWSDGLPVACLPLMMDIYYMFAPVLPAGAPITESPALDQSAPSLSRFTKALRLLDTHFKNQELGAELWTSIRDSLRADRSAPLLPLGKSAYHQTPGFTSHRRHLEALKRQWPNALFPFFAVDPRRPGVVDAVISGAFVGKNQTFQGVKLYPRLGYHPACDALKPLFAWCAQERIPIITHCAAQGFPPTGGHDALGLPSSFASVLERHPDLILDFAHFGLYEKIWADQIAAMIERYDHVYSDLSCYTRAEQIPWFKSIYWNRPKVRDRTMFGTDYDIFYAVSVGSTLDNYYQAFRAEHNPGAFNADDLLAMSSTTPQRFLSGVI